MECLAAPLSLVSRQTRHIDHNLKFMVDIIIFGMTRLLTCHPWHHLSPLNLYTSYQMVWLGDSLRSGESMLRAIESIYQGLVTMQHLSAPGYRDVEQIVYGIW